MAATTSRLAMYSASTSARVRPLRKLVSGLYEVECGLTPAFLYAARSACTAARVAVPVEEMAYWLDGSTSSAWAAKAARDRTTATVRAERFMVRFPFKELRCRWRDCIPRF